MGRINSWESYDFRQKTEEAIEGIVAIGSDNWNMYGGSSDGDNSGEIAYISIRHTGTEVAPDSELQGLTLVVLEVGQKFLILKAMLLVMTV